MSSAEIREITFLKLTKYNYNQVFWIDQTIISCDFFLTFSLFQYGIKWSQSPSWNPRIFAVSGICWDTGILSANSLLRIVEAQSSQHHRKGCCKKNCLLYVMPWSLNSVACIQSLNILMTNWITVSDGSWQWIEHEHDFVTHHLRETWNGWMAIFSINCDF